MSSEDRSVDAEGGSVMGSVGRSFSKRGLAVEAGWSIRLGCEPESRVEGFEQRRRERRPIFQVGCTVAPCPTAHGLCKRWGA
ncbi:unnamed protein product [Prunus armeniaca]